MGPPQAVTFDFWDTLVVADAPATRALRRTAVLAVVREAGRPVGEPELEAAFDEAVRVFNEQWAANAQYGAFDAARSVVASLGLSGDAALADAVTDAFLEAGTRTSVVLTPGAPELLRELDDAGVRIGIVCDVGLTPSPVLRTYLEAHGVLGHFDHWSFSDEVGVYKPDAIIFRHALDGLGGVDPAAAVHVGDLRRTDVAGARAMGMTAVRYRGVRDDPDAGDGVEGHHVLDHHADLPALLDLT